MKGVAVTTVRMEFDGAAAFHARTRRLYAALDAGAKRAANKGAQEYQRAIARQLRKRTHPLGTPTNSPPGQPPALVTGHMMRSTRLKPARAIRAHVYEAAAGPTAVQSRIHELGGWTGAGHRTYLPPRPYVGPARREATPRVRQIVRRELAAAVRAA